jgi:hypothetical protein
MWLDCGGCPRKHEKSLVTDFLGEAVLLLHIFEPEISRRCKMGVRAQLDVAHDAQRVLFF